MPRIEVAGYICLSRPRPTQSCRADDDDDDISFSVCAGGLHFFLWKVK